MASFTDLEVWKQSREIRNWVSELTKTFPAEEKYRLTDQIIRASRSIGIILPRGIADFIIKTIFVFVLWQEAHCLKL
jgi:hypothetical protein